MRRPNFGSLGQMLQRSLILLLSLLAGLSVMAEDGDGLPSEHPYIKSFTLTVLDGRVQVDWVMQGGSTCDGNEV